MPARLIAICIDAANPALLRGWAADGTLPVLGNLFRQGLSAEVLSLESYFVGSTWATFHTGCSPARHGFHYLVQLRPGTYELFKPGEEGMVRTEPFWTKLSRAGQRVAMLDTPLIPLDPNINGVHLIEWGGHDAQGGFATAPPELARDIVARYGLHPTPPNCDGISRTAEGFEEFVRGLERGANMRAGWTRELLARESWDMLLQVFTESHCAGHQAWHLHDPRHPGHDPALSAALGDPIRRTYRAIDTALGEILEDAGSATVIVFACHGMDYWYGAHVLMRDILVGLGVTLPAPAPTIGARARAVAEAGWMSLPKAARAAVKRALRRGTAPGVAHAYHAAGATAFKKPIPPQDVLSRCFPVMNGHAVDGIRINLRGREPAGLVDPGAEQEALEGELIGELLAISDDRTGGPLIRAVRRSRDLYQGDAGNGLPDLLVEWDETAATGNTVVGGGAGAVIRARSPRIGVVEGINRYARTGEHRREGFLVATGSGIGAGSLPGPVSLMDLAPTFAAVLGVEIEGVDGRAVSLARG